MSFRGTVGAISDPSDELQFFWKVENFFLLSGAVNDYYTSPAFHFSDRRFHLLLYPNGMSDLNASGWVGLFLVIGESCPPLEVRYTMGVQTANGDVEEWLCHTYTFHRMDRDFGSGVAKCIKISELILRRQELVPYDVLTIYLTLKKVASQPLGGTTDVVPIIGQDGNEEHQTVEKTDFVTLGQNLKDLYLTGKDCDIALKVGDKMFRAHKLILEARTPVLAATFSSNKQEAETGVMCVEDCQPEAFDIFLRFVYSDMAEDLTGENIANVYCVADRFDLPGLKKECVRYMLSNLDASSVCGVIALAERHNEQFLQEKATEFFVKNARDIFQTAVWRKFMAENNRLANDLIIRGYENSK